MSVRLMSATPRASPAAPTPTESRQPHRAPRHSPTPPRALSAP